MSYITSSTQKSVLIVEAEDAMAIEITVTSPWQHISMVEEKKNIAVINEAASCMGIRISP